MLRNFFSLCVFCINFLFASLFSTGDLTPHLMDDDHPVKGALDAIFSEFNPLKNDAELHKSGFNVVSARREGMRVVSHPELGGYLLKLFPREEQKNQHMDISWAVERCTNARQLQALIKEKNLKHFLVPAKCIYIPANVDMLQAQGVQNYVVLVVEDMQILSSKLSRVVWANLTSLDVVDELFAILKHGYSSCHLPANMPFSQVYGKFACIDTEEPHLPTPYHNATKYLPPNMQRYWLKLVDSKGQ
jgi:hypothetical protein